MTREEIAEVLEWDSEFFGLRIGRVRTPDLTPEAAPRLAAWARAHALRCVYFLVDAVDSASIRTAEEIGFRHVDVRVTRGRSLRGPLESPPEVEAAREDDLPALREIARRSHRASRFYQDPGFPDDRCDALYERWLERGFEEPDQQVLVVRQSGQPLGYIVCSNLAQPCGRISLVAVAADASGAGLGQSLARGALAFMASRGCERADVVSQGRNVPANRLYERLGFLTLRMEHWLHLWLDEGGG